MFRLMIFLECPNAGMEIINTDRCVWQTGSGNAYEANFARCQQMYASEETTGMIIESEEIFNEFIELAGIS